MKRNEAPTQRIFTNLKTFKNSRIFTNFKTLSHEFSIYEIGPIGYSMWCVDIRMPQCEI